ncbi:MAG: hypothetical protein IPO21_01180 [Bacteroidales bacterium]|nr:hypothetical protein [Bacteroidales bacterium]
MITEQSTNSTISQYFVKIVNTLLTYLSVTSLGILIIFNSGTIYSLYGVPVKNYVYYIIIGFTFLIPLIVYSIKIFLTKLLQFTLTERYELMFPSALQAIVLYFCYSILKQHEVLVLINSFLLSQLLVTIFLLIFGFFSDTNIQISYWGSLLSLTFILLNSGFPYGFYVFFIVLLLTGVVASTILYLNINNQKSTYIWFFMGFFLTFLLCK